jgi:hypothetical protein
MFYLVERTNTHLVTLCMKTNAEGGWIIGGENGQHGNYILLSRTNEIAYGYTKPTLSLVFL